MAESVQVGFRLPVELAQRLDAFAAQLRVQNPGVKVTRSDAARTLMLRALAVLEDTSRPAAKSKPTRKT